VAISGGKEIAKLALMFQRGWRSLYMDDDARAFDGLRRRLQ
jgi:hypothetical protein